jgi:hypothetical protein
MLPLFSIFSVSQRLGVEGFYFGFVGHVNYFGSFPPKLYEMGEVGMAVGFMWINEEVFFLE